MSSSIRARHICPLTCFMRLSFIVSESCPLFRCRQFRKLDGVSVDSTNLALDASLHIQALEDDFMTNIWVKSVNSIYL